MGRVFYLMTLGWLIGAPFVAAIFGLYAFIVRMRHVGRYNVFHWIDLLALPIVVLLWCIVTMYHGDGKSLSNLWTEMPLSCLAWCALFAVRCVLVLFGVRWSNRTHAIVGLALALAAAVAIQSLVPPLPE